MYYSHSRTHTTATHKHTCSVSPKTTIWIQETAFTLLTFTHQLCFVQNPPIITTLYPLLLLLHRVGAEEKRGLTVQQNELLCGNIELYTWHKVLQYVASVICELTCMHASLKKGWLLIQFFCTKKIPTGSKIISFSQQMLQIASHHSWVSEDVCSEA